MSGTVSVSATVSKSVTVSMSVAVTVSAAVSVSASLADGREAVAPTRAAEVAAVPVADSVTGSATGMVSGSASATACVRRSRLWRPGTHSTGVSQPKRSSSSPETMAKKRRWSSRATGPALPSPTGMRSTERMGVTSAADPVKNTSSAM